MTDIAVWQHRQILKRFAEKSAAQHQTMFLEKHIAARPFQWTGMQYRQAVMWCAAFAAKGKSLSCLTILNFSVIGIDYWFLSWWEWAYYDYSAHKQKRPGINPSLLQ